MRNRNDGHPPIPDGGHQQHKVERISAKYDLPELGDELVASWTGESEKQRSLRELADHTNKRILRTALEEKNEFPLEEEIENLYRHLTDDEVSKGMSTEVKEELKKKNIDVESLQKDFISHNTIHKYLIEVREASKDEESDRIENSIAAIQRLNGRVSAVAENTLTSLRNTGRISLGEFNLLITIDVYCSDCENQYEIIEMLKNGGCECE